MILLLLDRLRRTHEFPPKAVVQRQFSCDFPIVLEEQVMRVELKVRGRCADGAAHVRRIAEQKIGDAAAGARNRIARSWVQFGGVTCIESEAAARTVVAVQQETAFGGCRSPSLKVWAPRIHVRLSVIW